MQTRTSGTARAASVLAALLLAGCGTAGPLDERSSEIEAQRARWAAVRPASYEYGVRRLCFCGPGTFGDVRVTVVDGRVAGRVYVEGGGAVPEEYGDLFPTVDGLFEILLDAVDREAASIDATYDDQTGVPLEIRIDYIEMAIDEELAFEVFESVAPLDR